MSHKIPFHRDTFQPKAIPGNNTAAAPVEFDLSALGGPELARLKSLLYGLGALSFSVEWSPELTRNVTQALRHGPEIFMQGVDAIRHLTVPAALAVKAGVLAKLDATQTPDSDVAITTGEAFAKVAPWTLVLSLEVAMQLAKLSGDAEIDPRFFGLGSGSPETPGVTSGTADSATTPPDVPATVAAPMPMGD